jgi:cyclopropane-fatty-acyl-phospholipid synthase
MWLLDKGLKRLVKRGELTLIDHKGREWRYGAPEPGLNPVVARLTDGRIANHIARDPGVGAAEAYMDGRLVLERGDILDLILIVRRNNVWGKRPARATSSRRAASSRRGSTG